MKFRNDLTAERVRELLDYDPDSGVFCWKVDRRAGIKAGDVAGTISHSRPTLRNKPARAIGIDGHTYLAHRLAFLHYHGRWPAEQIDHIDGDSLNNSIKNLREASARQNIMNSRPFRHNKTGFRGVSRLRRRYVAALAGKHIGVFDTAQEANAAYQRVARGVYGDFVKAA